MHDLEQHEAQQQELITQQQQQITDLMASKVAEITDMEQQLATSRQEFTDSLLRSEQELLAARQSFEQQLAEQTKVHKKEIKKWERLTAETTARFQKQADIDAHTIDGLNHTVQQLELQVSKLGDKNKKLQQRYQQSLNEVADLNDQVASLAASLQEQTDQVEAEQSKVASLTHDVAALEIQIQLIPPLHQQIQEAQYRVAELEAGHQQLSQEGTTIQIQLNELGKKLALLHGELSIESIHSIEAAESMLAMLQQVSGSIPTSTESLRQHLKFLKRQCIICFEEIKSIVFNCGHNCACIGCAEQISTCPICREPITSKIKLFT